MGTEADGEIGARANRAGTCITIVIQVMTRKMKHGVRGICVVQLFKAAGSCRGLVKKKKEKKRQEKKKRDG